MGRRKGSKNKPKSTAQFLQSAGVIEGLPVVKRGRGRPKGSLNKKTLLKLGKAEPTKSEILRASYVEANRTFKEVVRGELVTVKPPRAAGINDFYERHKGPFQFNVTRETINGVKRDLSSHFLPEYMDADDVQCEAEALLTDPRDTIISVNVWSVKEEQFVTSFRR